MMVPALLSGAGLFREIFWDDVKCLQKNNDAY